MTFRQIEYFMAIAENKNFSSAARKLYVSQPAISQQLSMMEQELGYTLLIRSKRTVELTPAGQIFYDACVKMLKIYVETDDKIKKMLAENSKQLRIGIIEGLSVPSLSQALKDFSFNHYTDNIRIESHSFSELTKRLSSNQLDLIITILMNPDNQKINQKFLLKTPCILAISLNHPLANEENLCIKDFDDDIFYQIANDELPTADTFMSNTCAKLGITPQEIINVPNPSSMLLMLESGSGVGILDKYCYHEMRQLSSFKSIELDISHDINAAWNADNSNPLIKEFVNDLVQTLREGGFQ